jgi:hypothetical protein
MQTTTERDPFKHLWDPMNERALVHQAITDYPTYVLHAIEPDHYYRPLAAKLALLAADAHELGPTTSPTARIYALGRDRGVLSPADEAAFIDDFMDRPLGTEPDPERLKRHRRLRGLREALMRAQAGLEAGEPERAYALIEEAGHEARSRLAQAVSVKSAPEFIADWLEQVEKNAAEGGASLGLPELKTIIGPISPGSVMVLGANTNVGKSAFAAEVMLHAADDGSPTGLIAMEDPQLITVARLVSPFAGVSPKLLVRGLEPERRHKGALEIAEYGERIFLSECIGGTEQHVCARMSVMAQRGAKLVIIDYIGEVHASIHQQDRRNEVRWVMSRLKQHAMRIGVALIVCSQLSRPKDHDPAREPTKHDLKEAGDLENSAEYIVMMWREKEHDFAPVNLKLAKSKMGGNGHAWTMQREVDVEAPDGRRLPGSGRFREVVKDRSAPGSRDKALLVEDYEARLSALYR